MAGVMRGAAPSTRGRRRCGEDAVVRRWGRVREDRLGAWTIGRWVRVDAVGEAIT